MAKLQLQHKGKTIKEYTTAYEMADDIENAIPELDAISAERLKKALRQNAFFFAIRGAKMTFGNGWRAILPA